MPDLSVIVPVFDEADNVVPLAREVQAALAPLNRSWELVFVDDGSRDATWERIAEARREIPSVRGLRLVRNSGQSAALWTGLQQSRAAVLATLDGDRQNDPADIPQLWARLEAAPCDFVCGHRTNRRDDWKRKISTRVARGARSLVLRSDLADVGCQMRVFRRTTLEGLFAFNGLHRFLPILVQGGGFRVQEVPVQHRPRVAGISKYGVWNRMWRGLLDLFAIAWFQRRRVRPVEFQELVPPAGPR